MACKQPQDRTGQRFVEHSAPFKDWAWFGSDLGMSSRSRSDPGGHSTLQFHAHQRQRCFWNSRPACKYPQQACEPAACMQLVQHRRVVRVGRTRVRGGFGDSKARTERQACRSVLQSGWRLARIFLAGHLNMGFVM